MRIIVSSSAPSTRTGYGIVTKALIRRLVAAGHFVRVLTKHEFLKQDNFEGIEVLEGTDTYLVNQMIDREKFDLIFTFWDVWALWGRRLYPKEKWVCYAPVNTDPMSNPLTEILKQTNIQVAMTRFGEGVLRRAGYDPMYAPHGIDTKVFRPSLEHRRTFQNSLGWTDENFVIGSVGVNYSDDVKGFIPLMLAFKEFHGRHPEARLFLGTLANERDTVKICINYQLIAQNLGLDGLIAWPDQSDYFMSRLNDDDMVSFYNGMDVFCLPTAGETFGLPLIEAQACGIPAITTNVATGPELCKSGWLIDVDRVDDASWLPIGTWRMRPRPSNVLKCLELAYSAWKYSDYRKIKTKAREDSLEYDWAHVWPMYWVPLWERLEEIYGNSERTEK